MTDFENGSSTDSLSSLEEMLQAREQLITEYMERENTLLDQYSEERAQMTTFWENLITETKSNAQSSQIASYQSTAKTIAKYLGLGIKEQAMIMIPFEIAEATKEMAQFFATKDPSHLAASVKHTLAVAQYAAAAKTSAGSGGSGSGSGGSSGAQEEGAVYEPEKGMRESGGGSHVVVNVGDGVVTDPREFARQIIDGLNEAYQDDVYIEFAS